MDLAAKLSISFILVVAFIISAFAANVIMKTPDDGLEDEYQTLKDELEITYGDDIYNDFLRTQITSLKKIKLREKYSEMSFYMSSRYNSGNEFEINRIYNCVFP